MTRLAKALRYAKVSRMYSADPAENLLDELEKEVGESRAMRRKRFYSEEKDERETKSARRRYSGYEEAREDLIEALSMSNKVERKRRLYSSFDLVEVQKAFEDLLEILDEALEDNKEAKAALVEVIATELESVGLSRSMYSRRLYSLSDVIRRGMRRLRDLGKYIVEFLGTYDGKVIGLSILLSILGTLLFIMGKGELLSDYVYGYWKDTINGSLQTLGVMLNTGSTLIGLSSILERIHNKAEREGLSPQEQEKIKMVGEELIREPKLETLETYEEVLERIAK